MALTVGSLFSGVGGIDLGLSSRFAGYGGAAMSRIIGVWEVESGPTGVDGDNSRAMLAVLRSITEAIPADAPLRNMTVRLGEVTWRFRRLEPVP